MLVDARLGAARSKSLAAVAARFSIRIIVT
jgi:hypothetical protein